MAYAARTDLEGTQIVLKEAGFTVSQPCKSRPSCFDFAARKQQNLVFIKIQKDIGNAAPKDSKELREIASNFTAAALIIGKEARKRPLEDDTVYARHNVTIVNLKTLQNVVLQNIKPLIQASPGGYYVQIDGESLKQRRQDLGLSVGEVADLVGISRRTIYGYERGLAKASVPATYNIVWALGIPAARPINIFRLQKKTHGKHCIISGARRVFAKHRILSKIFRKLAPLPVTALNKAPFDFLLSVPTEKVQIIGGIANSKETTLEQRIDEIISLSKVVDANPVLVTEDHLFSAKNIPCVSAEEFSRIKDPVDLVAALK